MMNRIPIESNHVTKENRREFGMESIQVNIINTLLFQLPDKIHSYVLDTIGKDGMHNMVYKLTRTNAEKLIKILIQIVDKEIDYTQYDKELPFQFFEYDTPEWHVWKNNERKNKLINK